MPVNDKNIIIYQSVLSIVNVVVKVLFFWT